MQFIHGKCAGTSERFQKGNLESRMGQTRDISEWASFVKDGIQQARQLAWDKSAKSRPNYNGVEKAVDEFTTRKLYKKLSQKQPMQAGALRSIITDGVWYPQRA
eukprot:4004563-Heterocapsa_arctica.AAC.1